MKHFIITLLSALTLSVSGLALAGAPPVEAPEVVTNPAVQQAPVEEVVETDECDAATTKCDTDETADVTETEEVEEITAS